jgi:fructokinase
MNHLVGGIEAGGTKFVCAVGTGPADLRAETRFPTTSPAETLAQATAFFREQAQIHGPLAALGIASFGPADPDPASPTYGSITSTPKPGWAGTDFGGTMGRELGLPVVFDIDVNGAALAEYRWGAAQGLASAVYLTIGTGIGGGAVVDGRLLHGLVHPEMGHMRLPRDPAVDAYAGHCPFHGDCLEGLAAGPAIAERWGRPAFELPPEHPAWELEAHYLALALHTIICVLSPQRIVMGGGVMEQPQIFPLLHRKLQHSLNGYVQSPAILEQIETYIVPPALGNRAGVLGAIALGLEVQR